MNSTKPYLNFDLLLTGSDQNYRAKVTHSPTGQASNNFTLPFSEIELENFILKTSQNRSNIRSMSLGSIAPQSVEMMGASLFDCLFTDDIAERYRTSLVLAKSQGKGLRVRLGFSDAPTLIDIPWELLFDSDNKLYVALSSHTPVIRKLDLAHLPTIRQVEGCLQILVMISSPKDHPPLDVDREWDQINQATQTLQETKRITLTRIEPSLLSLQREVRRGDFHIFHFIGHGGFSQASNDGVLVLEDANQKGDLISGQQLGAILHDESSLQLAFLNSCHGGRTSVSDPFAGVGQSLLQKGMPAVIAMQFEITDEAAINFSSEFYNALADGCSIETAMTEARKMIYASGNKLEWATPVLYTSIESGVLLKNNTGVKSLNQKPKGTLIRPSEQPKMQQKPPTGKYTGLLKWLIPLVLILCTTVLVWNLSDKEPTTLKLPDTENITLVKIPAGHFSMGNDSSQSANEKPAHKVIFDKPFWMSKTEITFDQYDAYVNNNRVTSRLPDDHKWGTGLRPVIKLTWYEAKAYANWLSSKNDHALQCRLPSEAEWEYAARAGTTRKYAWGDTPSHEKANYGTDESPNNGYAGSYDKWMNTAPVASFPPNQWGLHDMYGNVWEWVEDTYQENYDGAPDNGEAWVIEDKNERVARGGAWDSTSYALRSTYRHKYTQDGTSRMLGFRVVCAAL
jgi:formylglycine-generating enzyme required for sulfatase activity